MWGLPPFLYTTNGTTGKWDPAGHGPVKKKKKIPKSEAKKIKNKINFSSQQILNDDMSLGMPNGVLIRVDSRFRTKTELKCRQLVLSFKGRNVKLKGFVFSSATTFWLKLFEIDKRIFDPQNRTTYSHPKSVIMDRTIFSDKVTDHTAPNCVSLKALNGDTYFSTISVKSLSSTKSKDLRGNWRW